MSARGGIRLLLLLALPVCPTAGASPAPPEEALPKQAVLDALLVLAAAPDALLDGVDPKTAEETWSASTIVTRLWEYAKKRTKEAAEKQWEKIKPEWLTKENFEKLIKYSYGMNPFDFWLYSTRGYKMELLTQWLIIGAIDGLSTYAEGGAFMTRFFKLRAVIGLGVLQEVLQTKTGEEAQIREKVLERVKADFKKELAELIKRPVTEEGKTYLTHDSRTEDTTAVYAREQRTSASFLGLEDQSSRLSLRRESYESRETSYFERVTSHKESKIKGEDSVEHKEWTLNFVYEKFIQETVGTVCDDLRVLASKTREMAETSRRSAATSREKRKTEKQQAEKQLEEAKAETEKWRQDLQKLPPDATPEARGNLERRVREREGAAIRLATKVAQIDDAIAALEEVDKKALKQETLAKQFERWIEIVSESRPHLEELHNFLAQRGKKDAGLIPLKELTELSTKVEEVKKRTWWDELKDLGKLKDYDEFKDLFKAIRGMPDKEEKKDEGQELVMRQSREVRVEYHRRWDRVQLRMARLRNFRAASLKIDHHAQDFYAAVRKDREDKIKLGAKIPKEDSLAKVVGLWVWEWMKKGVDLLDFDAPQLRMNPDADAIGRDDASETLIGWYAEAGQMYEGWADVSDETSGINPQEVHFFVTNPATKTTRVVEDARLIYDEDPQSTVRSPFFETRYLKGRIRYRFRVNEEDVDKATGRATYVVWGYVRDRAGHASCDLANLAQSVEPKFESWSYGKMVDETLRLESAKFTKDLSAAHFFTIRPWSTGGWLAPGLDAAWTAGRQGRRVVGEQAENLGLDPKMFRRYGFHVLNLTLERDPTPPRFRMLVPDKTEEQLETEVFKTGSSLSFTIEVQDPESHIEKESLAVWLTEYGGGPVEDWSLARLEQEKGLAIKDAKPDPKRSLFTKAEVSLKTRALWQGLFMLDVQAKNRAGQPYGQRYYLQVGKGSKGFTLRPKVDPLRLHYAKGASIKLGFRAVYAYGDRRIVKARLRLVKAPEGVQATASPDLEVRGLDVGARVDVKGEHAFTVSAEKVDVTKAEFTYEVRAKFDAGDFGEGDEKTWTESFPLLLFDKGKAVEDPLARQKVYWVETAVQYETLQGKWRPVPRGTMVNISQIYKMMTVGSPKYVEQYVGYGEALSDDGVVSIRITPEGAPPYKVRFAVRAQAREKAKDGGWETIAAVSPGTVPRPFIFVTKEMTASEFEKNAAGMNVFSFGSADIPFHSNYYVQPNEARGITIPWEGELSTGGTISPYGHDMGSNPVAGAAQFFTGGTFADLPMTEAAARGHGSTGVPLDLYGSGAAEHHAMKTGLIRQNHTGGLRILGNLVQAHRFATGCELVTDRFDPYETLRASQVPIVLRRPTPKDAGKPEEKAVAPEVSAAPVTRQEGAFRYREVSRTVVENEAGFEADIVYEGDEPPSFADSIRKLREREEVEKHEETFEFPSLLVADTGHDQVMEVSGGTRVLAITGLRAPASVERNEGREYLVAKRAANEVAIVGQGNPWTFGTDDPATPESEALAAPEYASWTSAGTILIADGGNRRVLEVDRRTKRILWSHAQGLVKPVMATETADGAILVVDEGADRVFAVDRLGAEVRTVPGLKRPQSALALPRGELVIADSGNNRALLLDEKNQVLRELKETRYVAPDATGKPVETTRPVRDLRYAFFDEGFVYLVEGNLVIGADAKGREISKWGDDEKERLFDRPECASLVQNSVTLKTTTRRIVGDPVYEWIRKIRVRRERPEKTTATDVFISEVERKKPEWRIERTPLEIRRIAANWSPYGDVPGSLGKSDTVFAFLKDVPRILVRGAAKNPDEGDPHVVLRAYASFFRHQYLEKNDPPTGYARLDERDFKSNTVRTAWEHGWDYFLPCAILDDPVWTDRGFPKQRGEPEKPEEPLVVADLRGLYDEIAEAYAKNPRDLATKHRAFRGLDSGYAWAMLFWRLYEKYNLPFINHVLTYARHAPASVDRYIDIPTLVGLYPEDAETFAVLGFIPKPALEFPSGELKTLETSYPKLSWEPNGLMYYPDQIRYILEIAEGKPDHVIRRLEGEGETSFDFGKVLKPEETAAKLGTALRQNQVYYWRAIARVDSGGSKYEVSAPWGAFVVRVPRKTIASEGGSVPLKDAGELTVPPGTFDRPVPISVQTVQLPPSVGSHTVVNGKAVDIDTENIKFQKLATLGFKYDPAEIKDPRGLGIYTFEPETGEWEYVGGQVDPERKTVTAPISHTSLYALMIDNRPPGVKPRVAGPNPSRTSETVSLGFSIDETARIHLTVVKDRLVRTIVRDREVRSGSHEFPWDGLDEKGDGVPPGEYLWTITAVDRAGNETRLTGGRILRSDAPRTVLRGEVRTPKGIPSEIRAEVLETTLAADAVLPGGGFEIRGLVPGRFDLRIAAPGMLPLTLRNLTVTPADEDLGEIALTDRALEILEPPPAVVVPGRPWTLRYRLAVPCRLEVETVGAGRPPLSADQPAGTNWLEWTGEGMPNGFASLRVWAVPAPGERLLQGEYRVLVDAGLVARASAYPLLFSPNGDAYDDESAIDAVSTHAGTLDAAVLDQAGKKRRTLASARAIAAGRVSVTWDGKDDRGETLPDGLYTIRLAPSYPGPIPSREVDVRVSLDRTPPKLGEISPATGAVVATGQPRLRARLLSDPKDVSPATLKIKIDEVTADPDSFDPATGWIEFTPKTSLGTRNSGVHVAIFYAQDQAGNYAEPAATAFTVKLDRDDKTPPKLEILGPKEAEKVYGQTYSVLARLTDAESGINPDSIVLHVNGRKVASKVRFIIPGKSGKPWDLWQYEKSILLFNPLTGELRYNAPLPGPGEPPAEGRHEFTLDAEDHGGRMARSVAGKFELLPDPIPPKVLRIEPANGTRTAQPRPSVRIEFEEKGGSGLDWAALRLLVDGQPVDPAELQVDKDSVRWTPRRPMTDARDHVILADIRDRAGNRSETATSVFTVAPDAPSIEILEPRPDGRALPTSEFRAAVGEWEGSLRLDVDGVAVPLTVEAGRATALLRGLSPGRHRLRLAALDSGGEVRARSEIAWFTSSDLQRPVASVSEPSGGKVRIEVSDDASGVDWSATDLRLDGRPVVLRPGAAEVDLPALAAGDHVLVLRARDRAGNEAAPVIRVFTVK